VDVLTSAARRHRERLILIALGPLTNVARALERDAAAMRAIGRVVVMGGAVGVPGNVTPSAEFNIHVDPDAARRVFEGGLAIELVPLDATRQAILRPEELEPALARRPGQIAERIAAFTRSGFRGQEDGAPGLTLHDPLAVGVAADPTLVGWERARITVGADGETRRAPGVPNCRVAVRVDRPRFIRLFLERLWGGTT
jgi:inosine-uridine nucleoside N-ribohydrolase